MLKNSENIIREIEMKESLHQHVSQGLNLWHLLRIDYWQKAKGKLSTQISQKQKNIFSVWYAVLSSFFYGFPSWFSRYEAMVFSDVNQRKLFRNSYWDNNYDYLTQNLRSKTLFVERARWDHYPRNKIPTANIVSTTGLDILITILAKFITLIDISEDFFRDIKVVEAMSQLKVDYQKSLKKFWASYHIYRIVFFIYRPRFIFVNCSYGKFAVVYAAKKMGIKVIEIQHGLIGKNHFAYHCPFSISSLLVPDELWVYGNYDLHCLSDGKFISSHKVKALGSFFMSSHQNQSIQKFTDIRILVSLQLSVQDQLLSALIDFALKNPTVYFDLLPRREIKISNLPENVKIIGGNFYQLIQKYRYHLTVFSTCAIESTFFGVKNIIVEIDGKANMYLPDEILKSADTVLIEQKSDWQKLLKLEPTMHEEKNYFFTEKYEESLKERLRNLNA